MKLNIAHLIRTSAIASAVAVGVMSGSFSTASSVWPRHGNHRSREIPKRIHEGNPVPYDAITVLPDSGKVIPCSQMRNIVFSTINAGCDRIGVNMDFMAPESMRPALSNGKVSIHLIPSKGISSDYMELLVPEIVTEGKWTLTVPEGFFLLSSHTDERTMADLNLEDYMAFDLPGAWHVAGEEWTQPPMFSIHDDDGIDINIPSSGPSGWMRGGYLTTMYPLLESLGLTGGLALEGQRIGFTSSPPVLNENGRRARRLQEDKGWDLMCHSMTARYYSDNYYVESLRSELAARILREGTYNGEESNYTTSVYDAESGQCYRIDSDKSRWVLQKKEHIKAYVRDYDSGHLIMMNPVYPVDYQWGEWFELARQNGLEASAWVSCGGICSHALVPGINEVFPNGFGDLEENGYNTVPLASTANRLSLDGLYLPGYKGETDTDNSFNEEHYRIYKDKIDAACAENAWIAFSIHAYRPCYYNYRPGALVSEGGTYPDEWVYPVRNPREFPETFLEPPVEKGINDWSEWYPCPGTRLEMVWKLLKYAREKGMVNVSSAKGFEIMGNKFARGMFTKGGAYDIDKEGIAGSDTVYPHFVIAPNGELSYYQTKTTSSIRIEYDVKQLSGLTLHKGETRGTWDAISVEGLVREIRDVSELPSGLWIVNGTKVLVR